MSAEPVAEAAKPPYRVPLLSEILELPWNGLTVATFFAGGGGSSLGYRMAGYHVVFANEIVEAARDCYKANAAPWTVVDPRDIREVKGDDVLDAVEAHTGRRELDLLDGSPPCQSFSTAGIRDKGWGREMSHADGTKQVSDDLFLEYARILREVRPRTFVAENVSGLVKGKARGYFALIHRELTEAGYRVQAKLLDAQWLGVPQQRQRVIFMGVRDDLGHEPCFPTPLPYRYTIRDALPNLTAYRYDNSGAVKRTRDPDAEPAPAVTVSGGLAHYHHQVAGEELVALGTNKGEVPLDAPAPTVLTHGRLHTQSELSAIVHRPPERDDVLYVERGPAPDAYRDETSYDDVAPTVAASGIGNAREYQASVPGDAPTLEEYADPENGYNVALEGHAIAGEWDKLDPGQQSDRYFSLVRPDPDAPVPTVTASNNRRGVAGVTHPLERRKLTLAELRRLCSFPDDFALPGSYQDGWTRLGNAVPPVMMRHVAEAVRDGVLLPSREDD